MALVTADQSGPDASTARPDERPPEEVSGLVAPFPYYGAKRVPAPEIWGRFGDVDHYVEPFAGSLAVLLARPGRGRPGAAETVNDADCLVANFWRALKADPAGVAEAVDYPVIEADLHARHLWLANRGRQLAAKVAWDPEFFDARVAGWWAWGLSAWVGGGWCSGDGPWRPSTLGLGYSTDAGIYRRIPAVGDNAGKGVHSLTRRAKIGEVLAQLAARLRYVRVLSGDWSRAVSPGALGIKSFDTIGVVVDPPYGAQAGAKLTYATETAETAQDAATWALGAGESRQVRIAFCCYSGTEISELFARAGWSQHNWRSIGNRGAANTARSRREAVWFSPGCLGEVSPRLFDFPVAIDTGGSNG